jgi:alpha-beta hydrolase superfamily lysophospholipase
MSFTMTRLNRHDGTSIALYQWPAPVGPIRAAVQIAHGLAEHAGRYDRLAQALTRAGYAVFASDHRGHGKTAEHPSDLGYFADRDGFTRVLEDVYAVNRHIAGLLPNVPRVLFGHSFGSFVAQAYLFTYGDSVSAVVLSGTNSGGSLLARLGNGVARIEKLRLGGHKTSKLLQALTFGSFNKSFAPTRTEFDWLSRDPVEVDKYIADPLCGFDTTIQGFIDLTDGLVSIEQHARHAQIPKNLPIYLFAGETDPVGQAGKGPRALAAAYERAGLRRVNLRMYPEARHETLNETNRDEVTSDLLAWLDANVTKQLSPTDSVNHPGTGPA